MKKLLSYYVILMFSGALYTCKKYPEDPKVSFEKPIKRLTDVWWYINEYVVDGEDSTNIVHCLGLGCNPSFQHRNMPFWFHSERNFFETSYHSLESPSSWWSTGEWKFNNKKKELIIHLLPLRVEVWKIEKLTDSDMILEGISGEGKLYRIKFKKYKD